jgi:hypothetical protein
MLRQLIAIAALSALSRGAFAGEAPLDRSALSYDENVIINTVCAAADHKSKSAYDDCVRTQLDALMKHPSPDRSALSAQANLAIEHQCSDFRNSGFAEYNGCLTRAMSESKKPDPPLSEAGGLAKVSIAALFEKAADDTPAATPAVATPPLPSAMLGHRPDKLNTQVLSPTELYKKVERSVYVVLVTNSLADARARSIGQGSAVAITEHLLVTNCHVVKDRRLIAIMQGTTHADAKLVAADAASDRCVIKTDELSLTPVGGIRAYESLDVGERVFAVGAPQSFERTLSEGLISGLRETRLGNTIQTSAPISPGSSGGGLFDERGNLIGLTTAILLNYSQNINFAVSASDFWN